MANPILNIDQVQDQYIRKNFENLRDYFAAQNQLLDFKFFDLNFKSAEINFKQAHGLTYAPLDVIVTRLTGLGRVTFRYADFDSTFITLDASAACRVRFFVGTCGKVNSTVNTETTDKQKFTNGF